MAHAGRIVALVAALAITGGAAHAQFYDAASMLRIDPEAEQLQPPPKLARETTQPGAVAGVPDFQLSDDHPVTMQAEAMGYDQENGIVVAQGNVEVVQGPNILNADQITYFQRLNLVKAIGNVSMLQPNGDVYFADYVELKDDMKEGVIYNFRARLADNSVFAANEARQVNQNVTRMKQAVYSPCKLCPGKEPFWQMKAGEVEIDKADEKVRYEDARMEMFGVPIAYTPYFSHPTPDAEAKSGFLTPEYSSGANMGTTVKVPYYWRISPDKDVTLTPWYSTEVGALLEGNYRQLSDHGEYRAMFSGTFPEELDSAGNEIGSNEFRGHIMAYGVEEIDTYQRVGFNINRASDDTYLRRYRFGAERVLFSRVYGEAAKDRNYALVQGLAIQGLRATDNPDITPFVVPTLEGYYESDPYDSGLTLHAFGNMQSLTRDTGVSQQRLSTTFGGSIPVVTEGGHIFTTTANMRQDIYKVENVPIPGNPDFDGTEGRVIPQAALEWRYPMIQGFADGDAMTVEPIVLMVAQTGGNNPAEIANANEDNTLIELTDTNLFSLQRMPGLDTIDDGSRMAYGFRSQYLFAGGQAIDALFGQNYNFEDTPFPNSTRAGQNFSDLIGRFAVDYDPVRLGYRFAFEPTELNANRTELSAAFYEDWLSLNAIYLSIENNRYLPDSEEAILNASLPVYEGWSIYGGGRRDLDLNQMIASNAGLIYRNECFTLVLQGLRTFTRDRDIEPSTEVTLRVGFKNLGEFDAQ